MLAPAQRVHGCRRSASNGYGIKIAALRFASATHLGPRAASRCWAMQPEDQNATTSQSRRTVLLSGVVPCACGGMCGQVQRNNWYDQYFACAMATGMDDYEQNIAAMKQTLLVEELGQAVAAAGSSGAVASTSTAASSSDSGSGSPAPPRPFALLDLGVGVGPNFRYYVQAQQRAAGGSGSTAAGPGGTSAAPPLLRIVGIDPNPAMLPYARDSAASAGLGGAVELVQGSVEALPFEDGAFDAVVCTLVLCSVPDQAHALAEVRRVLRPSGTLFLIEHVLAPPDQPFLRLQQRLLDPLQRALADGCHLTRDTEAAVHATGWASVSLQRFKVEGASLIGPHIAGSCVA